MPFTRHELNEIAMCLRLGAEKDRADAEKAASLVAREHLERSATFRAELAERCQKMVKG